MENSNFKLFTHNHFFEKNYLQDHDTISRVKSVKNAFENIPVQQIAEDSGEAALRVHDADYVEFIKEASLREEHSFCRFPVVARKEMVFTEPEGFEGRHSLFFFDELTKADRNCARGALLAAKGAEEAGRWVLEKSVPVRTAYLLCRPPGHHAFRGFGGGMCVFNNPAIAASVLKEAGKVAVIDLDQEHGNGTQSLFYEDPRVLTISIHSLNWPLVSGFAGETGKGAGKGFNLNLPIKEQGDSALFKEALYRALKAIQDFCPDYLVLALGFDGHKKDSLPWMLLDSEDYGEASRLISALSLPSVITQEGGYNPLSNTASIRAFLKNWKSPGAD